MSNMQKVFDAIASGKTSRPAIVADTGLTDEAVQSALQNLSFRRRIEVEKVVSGGRHKGRLPGVYKIKTETKPVQDTPLADLARAWERPCA